MAALFIQDQRYLSGFLVIPDQRVNRSLLCTDTGTTMLTCNSDKTRKKTHSVSKNITKAFLKVKKKEISYMLLKYQGYELQTHCNKMLKLYVVY